MRVCECVFGIFLSKFYSFRKKKKTKCLQNSEPREMHPFGMEPELQCGWRICRLFDDFSSTLFPSNTDTHTHLELVFVVVIVVRFAPFLTHCWLAGWWSKGFFVPASSRGEQENLQTS